MQHTLEVAPVSDGSTSDDAVWTQETIEFVREHSPLSAIVAGVLDGFVACGMVIFAAKVMAYRKTMIKWRILGEVGEDPVEVHITIRGPTEDGWAGSWALMPTWGGKEPSVRAFRRLGYEPSTDPHNKFHVDILDTE